jgi:hypothetical protein
MGKQCPAGTWDRRGTRVSGASAVVDGELPVAGTYRLGEGLSCPGIRGNQDGISPPDLHTALSAGLQGHVSRRDAECRGMPFCPCCSRVDLPLRPDLCCLCVGAEDQARRDIPAGRQRGTPARQCRCRRTSGSRSDAARRTPASNRIAAPLRPKPGHHAT